MLPKEKSIVFYIFLLNRYVIVVMVCVWNDRRKNETETEALCKRCPLIHQEKITWSADNNLLKTSTWIPESPLWPT